MAKDAPIIIKKKKVSGHGHHGGSWKVAYADFVTAMMAFFMVMWLMGLTSEKDKKNIQGYFNDPLGFNKNQPAMRVKISPNYGKHGSPKTAQMVLSNSDASQKKAAERVVNKIKSAIKSTPDAQVRNLGAAVKFQTTDEGILMEFSESSGVVFFESGSAVVRSVAKALVARVAPVLAQTKRKLKINGHTDAMPYPSQVYDNWDLSNDRAQAIKRILKANGVPNQRIVEVSGLADTKLKNPANPLHFSNRRVTILLPWQTSAEMAPEMPMDIIDAETQAAFKKPKSFVKPVNLRPNH
ncbi:MAG: OmpA family protein [Armatimonadetes bacterium]|nr:OmpA family protein [Armatimonadota bacterium]